MRKLTKWLLSLFIGIAVTGGLLHMAPSITNQLFGSARVEWLSERFSETLREKSELIVYEVEVSAQETVSQEAWLIGTVQKVEIPYTFSVRYAIDLSQIEMVASDNVLSITLPSPQAKYSKLTVDEDNVRKQDWLYPLTAERYAEIKNQLEEKLLTEYRSNTAYQAEAWNNAVSQVEKLFDTLIDQNLLFRDCELQINKIEL